MAEFPVMEFPVGIAVSKKGDEVQIIPIVLKGSLRIVCIEKSGDEILIYKSIKWKVVLSL